MLRALRRDDISISFGKLWALMKIKAFFKAEIRN